MFWFAGFKILVPSVNSTQLEKDAAELAKFGYVQELFRDMGGFGNFAISFSVISILTGAIQLFGYGLNNGGPLQMSLGWLLVSVMTLFVALSMAELASAYPTSGALYHWSCFLGGPQLGWFTAVFNSIGQFAILAGIDYGLTQLLVPFLDWPNTLAVNVAVYSVILLSHGIFNHMGIRVVTWLNQFSAWYHIAVVALLFVALFKHGFAQPISFLFSSHAAKDFSPGYSFIVGLLLAQWTLTGFDASAHVSEETVDPRRRAPWGIFLAVVVSIVFGFIMLAAVTLSIPDLNEALKFGDNAFSEILKLRLGSQLGNGLTALIFGAMWLCGLSSLTSASRMLYSFARDGGLPKSSLLASVSTKFRTPHWAIWSLCAAAFLLVIFGQVYSAVVSVATIALYISYGLPIAAKIYHDHRGGKAEVGPWNLGKFSKPIALIALIWILIISVIFVLPPNEQAGITMAIILFIVLGFWLFRARRHFRGPKHRHGIGNLDS